MQEFEKILMDAWHEFTNKKFCLTKSLDQLTSRDSWEDWLELLKIKVPLIVTFLQPFSAITDEFQK